MTVLSAKPDPSGGAKEAGQARPSGMADGWGRVSGGRRYLRVFRLLVSFGHSGQKAAEVVLDAKRKDKRAMQWIRLVRKWSP